ncbi:Uncharacterized protein Fot_28850 [Forsythia ovata]|uniref:Uncharacterized protein n=1 Tax=Forsythia ovata TaxID=205694 RepID=A0ABD1TQ96_9LAMI
MSDSETIGSHGAIDLFKLLNKIVGDHPFFRGSYWLLLNCERSFVNLRDLFRIMGEFVHLLIYMKVCPRRGQQTELSSVGRDDILVDSNAIRGTGTIFSCF